MGSARRPGAGALLGRTHDYTLRAHRSKSKRIVVSLVMICPGRGGRGGFNTSPRASFYGRSRLLVSKRPHRMHLHRETELQLG